MYAQHHKDFRESDKVAVARLLLEANAAYGESNNPGRRHGERIAARQSCRSLLSEALAINPDEPVALGLLGRVEMDDGQFSQAHGLFNASLTRNPDQPQQYTNLGYWALATERPALAANYFHEALSLDRQSAAAFCGMAHAKRQQGQFDVAYLHYRSLLEREVFWPSVTSGMLACAEHLTVSQADHKLARDAILLLQCDGLPHQQIGHFVAAILRQQYDLSNPASEVFLDAASDDALLILALEKTLLPDPDVEKLVTLLRRAILAEVAHTAELRTELHDLVRALGIYANRTGYALLVSDEEDRLMAAINSSIAAQLALKEPLSALVGSLMISAMYGCLFREQFSPQLAQWNLVDWPVGLQSLMANSYYDPATEEAVKQTFPEKAEELAAGRADVLQAWPGWSSLAYRNESSLKSVIAKTLHLPTDALPDRMQLLLCGAESGQRALELAQYLVDVDVIAVDESLANIAVATRRAQELGLSNIVFWPWSLTQSYVADNHKVHWVEVGRLPSTKMRSLSLSELINTVTETGGIVHMHTALTEQTAGDRKIRQLIEAHSLKPDCHTLRQLRRMALNNPDDSLWTGLLDNVDFYGLGGCRDRWFRAQDGEQLNQLMAMVSNEVNWKLVKAEDTDGHRLELGPVQKQIRADALGSEVQSLVGQPLSVYFTRR